MYRLCFPCISKATMGFQREINDSCTNNLITIHTMHYLYGKYGSIKYITAIIINVYLGHVIYLHRERS